MRSTFKLIGIVTLASVAIAASAASSSQVILSVDQDLVALLKAAVWFGGIFITVLAFIGVAFFGWDVRKARASLLDAQKETRDLLNELKADFASMKALKENLEKLGAELEESECAGTKESPIEPAGRTSRDLIQEVIKSSNYEWTTIGRIVKRTGLTRDQVLEEARKSPEIQIGNGRKTQDFLFKLKGDG